MRTSLGLMAALGIATITAFACGGSNDSEFTPDGTSSSGGGEESSSGVFSGSSSGASGGSTSSSGSTATDIDETSLRLEPADAVLDVQAGASITQAYKLFGKMKGTATEVDVTNRAVFYVPDNYLVGGFPTNGDPLFTSRIPALATDPPQRGGKLTVEATIANSDGLRKMTTSLTIRLNAILNVPGGGAIPANPASKFLGTTPDAARAPVLTYPNNGAMLPPNLRRLDVQWRRDDANTAQNDLFEISFSTLDGTSIKYYSRCNNTGLVANACGFELDETGYGYLAESARGKGKVALKIRGANETSGVWGESAVFDIEFAENRVDGGFYYWRIQSGPEGIMRFDFGAAPQPPEMIIEEGSPSAITACPGCHTLSRDGTKMASSINGQNGGQLTYIKNLAMSRTDPAFLTVAPNTTPGSDNRMQFGSFNPDGSRFVAVYGDYGTNNNCEGAGADVRNCNLFFHDGDTGLRIAGETKTLAFKPDHPDWSPDGSMIAMTRVHGNIIASSNTTQMPKETSLELMKKNAGGTWDDPVTLVDRSFTNGVAGTYKVRYNPNFVPDSSFLLFNEAVCDGTTFNHDSCDADANPSAKVWAVKPQGNADPALRAVPVNLANSSTPGVADGPTARTGDTFPRSAPFKTDHRGGKLFWFTVASRRSVGLKATQGLQHLWMFAIDPAKILAGQDGSYTGFYLPFQDLQTSNHIGQWTERVVGGSAPPPPPVPPPPPPPPPPPVGGVR